MSSSPWRLPDDSEPACVVDLRGITREQMEAEWTAADVERKSRIVTGIGLLVNQPHGLVLKATQCQIGLRNDTSLPYGVPVDVWYTGIPISDWVQKLMDSTHLRHPA
jgi:hypothetical protein